MRRLTSFSIDQKWIVGADRTSLYFGHDHTRVSVPLVVSKGQKVSRLMPVPSKPNVVLVVFDDGVRHEYDRHGLVAISYTDEE